MQLVNSACESLEITVHAVRRLQIPYALNLLQFPDGRVLMTCGDEEAHEIVAGIVGTERVWTTEIPITHYPAFCYAGIRCLVTEQPPTFKKIQS